MGKYMGREMETTNGRRYPKLMNDLRPFRWTTLTNYDNHGRHLLQMRPHDWRDSRALHAKAVYNIPGDFYDILHSFFRSIFVLWKK